MAAAPRTSSSRIPAQNDFFFQTVNKVDIEGNSAGLYTNLVDEVEIAVLRRIDHAEAVPQESHEAELLKRHLPDRPSKFGITDPVRLRSVEDDLRILRPRRAVLIKSALDIAESSCLFPDIAP